MTEKTNAATDIPSAFGVPKAFKELGMRTLVSKTRGRGPVTVAS
jgi:hypothetical protein